MKNVAIAIIVACLASFGPNCSAEVPANVQTDVFDIGFNWDQVPDDKADTLVVFSASWCSPCVKMRPVWASLRLQRYKVLYINVNKPSKKIDPVLLEELMELEHDKVPTIYWYNSKTKETIGDGLVGNKIKIKKIKERLWKPSLSMDLVPELRR